MSWPIFFALLILLALSGLLPGGDPTLFFQ